MALWARTQKLSNEALRQVYTVYSNSSFPLEVRHWFADWIEEKPWKNIDESNSSHDKYAQQLLTELLTLLETKYGETEDFLARLKFENMAKQFRDLYSENPMNLVRVVKVCLETEEALVHMAESPSSPNGVAFQGRLDQIVGQEIQQQVEALMAKTEQTDQDLRKMQMQQEQFVIDYQVQERIARTICQLEQQPDLPDVPARIQKYKKEKEQIDINLLASAQQLLQQRIELAQKHHDTLRELQPLLDKVVNNELIAWKTKQKLAGNGAPFDPSMIDRLQKWCEHLADLIWKNRQQIIKVDLLRNQLPIDVPPSIVDIQPELNQIVTGLLSSLVTGTFIVEEQPPQVLKRDAKTIRATVRLLVGGKLNLQMTPPRVKATIISEQQARGLLQSDERHTQKCGELLNCEGPMDYHQHTGKLSITFRNMSLKTIKRADRKGTDVHTVAEEKFCILFTSEFNVGGNELKFQVWTLSLPVIVTVHGNQECHATATYLWDNQFSVPMRIPFQVPDSVPWPDVAIMLSTKFQQMTGAGLTDLHLKCIAAKLLPNMVEGDLSKCMVTWSQFNKMNLPNRNFTFWEWFWHIAKLVKEQLKPIWEDGSIVGFMERNEANDLLMTKNCGTFMLRFSDSTLGGITIAWVAEPTDQQGERQVWNLQPFTVRDFAVRGLADRIKDLHSLVTLYPDTPKDQAFGKHYSPATEQPKHGYVHAQLIQVIPGQVGAANDHGSVGYPEASSPFMSQPVTPRPDGTMDMATGDLLDVIPGMDYVPDDLEFNSTNNNITEWLSRQQNCFR